MSSRVLTWIAYVWCAVLLIQNASIATTVMQVGTPPEAAGYLWWSVGKMLVVCLALLAFIRHKSRATLLALAAAIVLAFPISSIAEKALDGADPPWAMLLYLSALLSYVATGALLFGNRALLAGKAAPIAGASPQS